MRWKETCGNTHIAKINKKEVEDVKMKDPVCGMRIDEKISIKKEYGGKTYHFCSKSCMTSFEKNPSHFAKKSDAESHPHERDEIYTCPMHPEVKRDKQVMCSECGMNLVPEKRKHDEKAYDKHVGHSTNMFLRKFWISLILTIPILIFSDLPEVLFGWQTVEFTGKDYLVLTLGSIVFFYGGWIFVSGAIRELKAKLPGMMTLIALAIIAAYLYSIYAVFSGMPPLFWELSTLITIMLLGHWIEMRAVKGAQGALKELVKLLPENAEVMRGKKTEIIPIDELQTGDVMLVKPGGKIPADGKVLEGESGVNESIVTGESRLADKKKNDEVIAGAINGDGSLKIEVTKIGESTFLAGVMKLVAEAQASKSRLQILSDKAALYLTIIAVVAGAITFSSWFFVGAGIAFAVTRLVSVLVIACPHALGLAVPLVASISTNMAANNGFLIKQRLSLEAARNIDIVLFDKTGTLTKGEFGVDAIMPVEGVMEKKVLEMAASVNAHSEHAIAKAIVKEAEKRKIEAHEVKDFQRIPGKGAKGKLGTKEVVVGNEILFKDYKIELDDELNFKIKKLASQGKTVVYVISDRKLAGAIALVDIIRDESKEAVKSLKEMGIKVAMVTGDSDDVASWASKELGIDEYFSRVLPDQKSEKVKILQERGMKVAMIGDGVNDAPALTQSDLGIAIGAGTNVAIESAGIILVRNDPRDIPKIIKLSKMTYSKMMQNLFWATGYNIVALPLAAGALAFAGIVLQPALAAIFMSASTVIVAVNAGLLRRKALSI